MKDSDLKTPDLITQYLIENLHQDNRKISIKKLNRPDGTVVLETSDGIVLNDILPENTKIIDSQRGKFSANTHEIYVPKKIESMGLFGKIALAHEFGHVLNPNGGELAEKFCKSELDFIRALTDEAKLDAILDAQNSRMDLETQAWEYGLIIADILGVDPILFEDLMNSALEHYFLKYFEDILDLVDLGEIDQEKELKFLEPKSQEYFTMTVSELKVFIDSLIESGKISSADEKLDRAIARASKQ